MRPVSGNPVRRSTAAWKALALSFPGLCFTVMVLLSASCARALDRVSLRNGFSVDCYARETMPAGKVRLYLDAARTSSMDVAESAIASIETVADSESAALSVPVSGPQANPSAIAQHLGKTGLGDMLLRVGRERRVNPLLLRSIVHVESGGRARAVSRAGAQGLMQLMPATARDLNVTDSFEPEQNVRGGAAYIDALLTRYRDNLQLALAAYNAGPAAVERYRGVPPFHETRAYITRVIGEFNRLSLLQRVGRLDP